MVGGSANYVGPSDPVSNSDDVILIESDDEQHSTLIWKWNLRGMKSKTI